MASSSILLILALLILVALFLAKPFTVKQQLSAPIDDERTALLAERERIIEALLELDFDQQLGKIPEKSYVLQRERLVQNGAKVLKSLDEMASPTIGDLVMDEDTLEALIGERKAERD